MGRLVGQASAFLFPSRCFSCERPLPSVQRLGACAVCWASFNMCLGGQCRRCAIPLPESAASGVCVRCAVQPLPFERALAAVSYDGHARRFLLRAKNGQRPEILRALAEQLSIAVALSGIARSVDAVVPVPGTFLARLRRGFDPALIIAEHVAYAVGAPLWKQALARRGPSGPPAKAMSARARWAGAGRNVRARRDVVDATLLLVDDVLTTGATAAACASALHMAGAAEVRIAVWARTPAPGPSFADSTQKHV